MSSMGEGFCAECVRTRRSMTRTAATKDNRCPVYLVRCTGML